jgi:hypothetical protein
MNTAAPPHHLVTGAALTAPALVCAVFALLRFAAETTDVPRPGDAARTAELLADRRPAATDTVALLPPWSLAPLAPLAAFDPVPGDGPFWELAQARSARVFLVLEPDHEVWLQGRALPAPSFTAVAGRLHLWELPGQGPARFDARTAIKTARVEVAGRPCTGRTRSGVHPGVTCDGGGHPVRVQREWSLVTENGADAVSVRLPKGGQPLDVIFEEVDIAAELVVALGHTRAGAAGAHRTKGVVRLQVLIDEVVVATLERAPSFVIEPHRALAHATFVANAPAAGSGFRADVLDTRHMQGPGRRLTLRFTTQAPERNEVAFDLVIPSGARP